MSSPALVTSVNLATLPFESLLYGIFVLLFILSNILFVYRTRSPRGEQQAPPESMKPILALSCAVFCGVTGHWIVSWIRIFAGFTYHDPTIPPHLYFSDMARVTQLLKSTFILPPLVLTDLAFIYRLWLVAGREVTTIIVPILTLLGLFVSGVNIIICYVKFREGDSDAIRRMRAWIISDLVFTICTNIYCTAFIAWKIWSVRRKSKKSTGSSLLRLLAIITESAGLYTSWMLIIFILHIISSPVDDLLLDSAPAIAGIAFMLINVRVGLGWATDRDILQSSLRRGTASDVTADIRFATRSEVEEDITFEMRNKRGITMTTSTEPDVSKRTVN